MGKSHAKKGSEIALQLVCLRSSERSVTPGESKGEVSDEGRASLVVQVVKNLPAVQQTQVRSLGQEDLLEERMATHSSILS